MKKTTTNTQPLNIQDWGQIPYQQALQQQQQLFDHQIQQKLNGQPTTNHLILCQHPHVYTLGKHGNPNNLLITAQQLQQQQINLIHTNRGGDITYHGPGQIVGYPIIDIQSLNLSLKQYINTIEQIIINTLKQHNIQASRLQGATGVWIEPNTPRARKIAAIGVKSSHYITMHGFALNVNTNLNYFNQINPCGITDKTVTSMQQEQNTTQNINQIKQTLIQQAQQLLS